MSAKTLMIQGTGSSVGKSLIVTALCRIFARQGVSVAPFKSQNMSLNSFITDEGHEMGRAQVVQAEAAGLSPSSLMNPVLLKPCGDRVSQVIVNGAVRATLTAWEYHTFRATLTEDVLKAFNTLAARHDLILIEGAGSPAEINLRENDLANMGMAELADAPVVLVGDIDRGGVFASLYGTVKLLEEAEQRRIRACIINKFRGDAAILEPGLRQLESLLARPVLGVLPYMDVRIDEEDSLTGRLDRGRNKTEGVTPGHAPADAVDIAVIRLPRLSNFTDFAVFDMMPDAAPRYVGGAGEVGSPDCIILPGSKNTMGDMLFLRESGLADRILDLHRRGTPVIGICGGYQMLGRVIHDPEGVESGCPEMPGLGLLAMETRFFPHKRTTQTVMRICPEAARAGILRGTEGLLLKGYEIHMGESRARGGAALAPLGTREDGSAEGAVNAEGTVFGTYLHGVFDSLAFTRTLLNNLRAGKGLPPLAATSAPDARYEDFRRAEYDRLADQVAAHLDMDALTRIIETWGNAG